MKIDYRQGLISATPGFLKISENNPKCIDIVVDTSPVVATIASGNNNYLISETVRVVEAWGPIENMLTNYLFWDIDLQTGKLSRGTTIMPVAKAEFAPEYPRKDQMWWSTSENRMYVYDGEKWNKVLRVLAGKFQSGKLITEETLTSQVDLNTPATAGYILFEGGNPVRDNSGEFLTSDAAINLSSGTVEMLHSDISFVASEDIAKLDIVSIETGYAKKASGIFEDGAASVPFGLAANPAPKNEKVNVLTAGHIVKYAKWPWKDADIGKSVYCDAGGNLTLAKPNSYKNLKVGIVVSSESVLLKFEDETDVSPELQRIAALNIDEALSAANKLNEYSQRIDQLNLSVTAVNTAMNQKADHYHRHYVQDIDDFSFAMDQKANVEHRHTIDAVDSLRDILVDKANVNHQHALSSLSDVDTSTAKDGQFLRYDAAINSWIAAPVMSRVSEKKVQMYILEMSDAGDPICFNSDVNMIAVLPSTAPPGFSATCIQTGNGSVEFQAQQGASINHVLGHNKTAGKWAVVELLVISNTTGTSAVAVLTGDTTNI
jgi:hypothetical protein